VVQSKRFKQNRQCIVAKSLVSGEENGFSEIQWGSGRTTFSSLVYRFHMWNNIGIKKVGHFEDHPLPDFFHP
jgi:hypothetical protein